MVITLEQLVRRGHDGLWWITDVQGLPFGQLDSRISASPGPAPEDPPPSPRTAAESRAGDLVREFLDRRLEGSGAERFLTEDALAAFQSGRGGLEPIYEERVDGFWVTYYETQGPVVLIFAALIDEDGHGCYEEVFEEYTVPADTLLIEKAVRLDGTGSACPGGNESEASG